MQFDKLALEQIAIQHDQRWDHLIVLVTHAPVIKDLTGSRKEIKHGEVVTATLSVPRLTSAFC